jgi:hypothetical protein
VRSSFAAALASFLLACGPLVMVPGGELSGTTQPTPPDWAFTDEIETVQLETRPDDPYSVNVWGVAAEGRLYVAAADPGSRWAQNIGEDPRVRLKLGEDVYELRAVRTEDPAERDAFLAAVKRKYDFEPDPDQESQAALFRLEPR